MAADRSPQLMFQGRVIRVEREQVTLANGRTLAIEAVRHRGSVVIMARPTPDHLVLIRQYRPVIGRWIWELPAGSLDAGESPDTAVIRECEEEIGLTPGRITLMASWYPSPGFCDEIMHFYLCDDLSVPTGPVSRDDDEQIEPATVSVDELRAMIADGRVVDMKTVLGLSLVEGRAGDSSRQMNHDNPEDDTKPADPRDPTQPIADGDLERVAGGVGINPQQVTTPTQLKVEWITSMKGE